MTKFKNRNEQLKSALGSMAPVERVKEAASIPDYNTKNKQGYDAYKIEDELRLISMLNTLKLEPQFYRSENQTMMELRDLIEKIALKDPYFVAQCIVYSRCVAEGMRSINHLAAALLAPFISGQDWAKRFYGLWNKKEQKGGCIFRPDDMIEILSIFSSLNKVKLTNSMKKGFASAIEKMDTYTLFKYKKSIIDVSNLVRPSSKLSKSTIEMDKKTYKAIDALMKGLQVSADTWEVAQSGAGQEVAKAVREGKLSKAKAEEVLKEAKADNWEGLLKDNRLGILAAVRNIRNILQNPRKDIIDMLCELLENSTKIRQGKVMPYQLDLAVEVLNSEFNTPNSRRIVQSLEKGYELAVPNLKELLPGDNLVIVDCSGSMSTSIRDSKNIHNTYRSTCCDKAALIAATIAKATNSDIIRFGSMAEWCSYNPNNSVFSLAKSISNHSMGGTSLARAFELITREDKVYDRIFILSDNECNSGYQRGAYQEYVKRVCSPYIYSVDLAAYGTKSMDGDKVNYYFGYGYQMFDDISSNEFNPNMHIEKIRKIII